MLRRQICGTTQRPLLAASAFFRQTSGLGKTASPRAALPFMRCSRGISDETTKQIPVLKPKSFFEQTYRVGSEEERKSLKERIQPCLETFFLFIVKEVIVPTCLLSKRELKNQLTDEGPRLLQVTKTKPCNSATSTCVFEASRLSQGLLGAVVLSRSKQSPRGSWDLGAWTPRGEGTRRRSSH